MEQYTEEIDPKKLEEEAKKITKSIIDKVVAWYCDIAKRYKGIENIDEEAKKRMASQADAALEVASNGLLAARKEVDEDKLVELVEKLIENGFDSEIPDVVYHDNLEDNPDIIDQIIDGSIEPTEDGLNESAITEGLGLTLAAGYLFGKLADVVLGPIGEKLHDIMTSAVEKKGQLNDDTKKAIEYYVKSLMLKYKDDESKLQEVFANGDTDTDSWETAMNKINNGELPDVGGLGSDSTITDAVAIPKAIKSMLLKIMMKAAAKYASKKIGDLTENVREGIKGYIDFLSDKYGNDEAKMKEVFYNGDDDVPSCSDALEDICSEDASLMAAENEDPYDIVAEEKEETDLEAAEGYEEDDNDREFRQKVYSAVGPLINGPAADKYFDILVDLSKRAIDNLNLEEFEDADAAKSEAIRVAIDEGLIYTDDQWTVMRYFQSPDMANFYEATEALTGDLLKVLDSNDDEEETDIVESLTESIESGTKAEQLYNTMLKAAEDLGTVTDEIRSKIEGYITFLKNKYADEQKMEEVFDNGDDTDKGVDNCEVALEKIFNGEVPSMNEEETVDDMVREAEEEDYEAENS